MAKSTHTPGPWTIESWRKGFKCEVAIQAPDGSGTTPVCWIGANRTEGENERNAHLIAAAPDLLAACKELLALWPLSGYELDAFCGATLVPMMHEAVKKAEGK